MPLARAAVTAIPWLGGPLDAVISTLGANAVEQRLTRFVEYLTEECAALGEEKLDKAFIASNDWTDAVLATFRAAARTGSEEKLRLYSRILVGAASAPDPKIPEPSALITALEELSPLEITLAHHFANMGGSIRSDDMGQYRRVVDKGNWDHFLKRIPEEAKPNWLFHLKRLERAGLIAAVTGGYGGSGDMHEPTPTLWRIHHYLTGLADGTA